MVKLFSYLIRLSKQIKSENFEIMRNFIYPFNKLLFKKSKKNFLKNLEDESLDFFLENVLRLLDLYFSLNKNFRKNIQNFDARYAFKSLDGKIDASVVFKDSKMKVYNKEIDNTNVTVVFKDGKALKNFLFSDSPDIIGSILNSEVSYKGNLNYLAKFAYLANHLKYQFTN